MAKAQKDAGAVEAQAQIILGDEVKQEAAGLGIEPQPVAEEIVDISSIMRQRVVDHQTGFGFRDLSYNPAIPNNPFDFSRAGLPKQYEYFQVQVPSKTSDRLNIAQTAILADYINTGWQFLTTDLVSRDGRNGKAVIPNFSEDNGRIIVAGCYIMYASKDWYNQRRKRNEQGFEDKRKQTREAMQQIEGVRTLNESVDVTQIEDYRGIDGAEDLLRKVLQER